MAGVNLDFVRIVEAQGRTPVGIPVLLFTDATLATDDPSKDQSGAEVPVVEQAAEDLGYDLDELELFSTESYLVQQVAGQLTVGP